MDLLKFRLWAFLSCDSNFCYFYLYSGSKLSYFQRTYALQWWCGPCHIQYYISILILETFIYKCDIFLAPLLIFVVHLDGKMWIFYFYFFPMNLIKVCTYFLCHIPEHFFSNNMDTFVTTCLILCSIFYNGENNLNIKYCYS